MPSKVVNKEVKREDGTVIEQEAQVETNIARIVKIKKQASSLLSTASAYLLGGNIKKYVEDAVNVLSKWIVPATSSNEIFKLKDSPARALLFGKDGKINENVASAIALAMDELMAINASSLQFNDDRVIAKMFGVQEENVTQDMRNAAMFSGASRRFLANDLGKAIVNNLAISQNEKDSDYRLYPKLIEDLGQMALVYGEAMEYIQPLDETYIPTELIAEIKKQIAKDKGQDYKDDKEYEGNKGMPTVKLNDKYKRNESGEANKGIEALKAKFMDMQDELKLESNIKHYRTSRYEKPRTHEIRNQPMSDVNSKTQKTVNALENMAMEVNIEAVTDYLTDDDVIGRKQALEIMGYVPLTKEGENNYTYKDKDGNVRKATNDEVESINARNSQIEKSFDELVLLADKVKKGEINNEIFYDYFISKNGRYFVDSAVTNPQTDKLLHRFLITAKKQNQEIDENNDLSMNAFYYAIAQSMGFDIDKTLPTEIIKFAKKVLDSDVNKIQEMLKGGEALVINMDGKDVEIEIEHLGHFIQGIQSIKAYKNRGKDGKFNSNISFETDAVTSAFGIKLLQFPIFGNIIHWAAKTGIVFNAKGRNPNEVDKDLVNKDNTKKGNAHGLVFNKIRSMGQILNSGVKDSYKTLASMVKLKPNDSLKVDKNEEATKRNVDIYNLMENILPNIFEVDENKVNIINEEGEKVVTKAARDMFKYPFMTFNYAAGMRTIARNLAKTLLEDVPSRILNNEMDDVLYKIIEDEVANHKNKEMSEDEIKARISEIKQELQEKPTDMIKLFKDVQVDKKTGKEVIKYSGAKLMTKMDDIVIKVYGDSIKEVMEEQFSELVKANETVAQSFRLMFRAYGIKYNEAIAKIEKENNGIVTLEDKKKILHDLRKTFPIIKSPFSDTDYNDGVAINDSKLEDVKGEGFTAYTHYMKDGKDSTLKAAALIREFEEAIAAGSVLPIHFIDGSLINGVLKDGDTNGIHDAFIGPLLKMGEKAKQYNEDMYEINRTYSMVDEVYDSLLRSVRTLSKEQFEQINLENKDSSNPIQEDKVDENGKKTRDNMDFNQIISNMYDLAVKVHGARNDIYSMGAKVFHMSSMEDTGYEISEKEAKGIPDRKYDKIEPIGRKLDELVKEYKDKEEKNKNEKTGEQQTTKEPADINEYSPEQIQMIKDVLFEGNNIKKEYSGYIKGVIARNNANKNNKQINIEGC